MRPNLSDRATTPLLTLEQVAQYLSISSRTVRRLIDDKELRCVQIGRQKRIDPKDLEAFVKANKE